MSDSPAVILPSLTPEQSLDFFKFYEEAAEKTKGHAWSQTTWILTLNTGIFAFSLKFFAEHRNIPAFLLLELISAGVGVLLSAFLFYVLKELGKHIRTYWTASNKIAAAYGPLRPFISEKEAKLAEAPEYRAQFPPFIVRLQVLAALFIAAHIAWAVVVARVLAT